MDATIWSREFADKKGMRKRRPAAGRSSSADGRKDSQLIVFSRNLPQFAVA
jgi:hypothetical protein